MPLASAIAVTVAIVDGTCDGAASRLFFRPGPAEHWPPAYEFPWSMLHWAAPWITGSLLLGGLAVPGARRCFLSDVLWSALPALGVCHLVYVHALRLHRIDESIVAAAMRSRTSVRWHWAGTDLVVLAAIGTQP